MFNVHLHSSAPLNLDAIRIMGVSAKVSDNPIGQFGTGFKYAIAVLLRTGHTVSIHHTVNGLPEQINFTTTQRVIRNKPFDEVVMVGPGWEIPMNITLELGKNWKVWMAYRELRSNAMDEAPWEITFNGDKPNGDYATTITINGQEFYDCAKRKDYVFIDSEPLHSGSNGQIYINANPTSPGIFYRGIRVGAPNSAPAFTYNVSDYVYLTEDRTVYHLPQYTQEVAKLLIQCQKREIIEAALSGKWEQELTVDIAALRSYPPSDAFLAFMRDAKLNMKVPQWAREYIHARGIETAVDELQLTPTDKLKLKNALVLCQYMAQEFDPKVKFTVVRSLGPDVYGVVRRGEIFISYAAFAMGEEFLAATILEEFAHKHLYLRDESRALQNWLFQLVAANAKRLRDEAGLPLITNNGDIAAIDEIPF